MKWFVVKIIFQIFVEGKANNNEFDNQWRLVEAKDKQEALSKAKAIADEEERDNIVNTEGKKITWLFQSIAKIIPVERLKNGAELFSEIIEHDSPKEYLQDIQKQYALQLELTSH